MENEVERTKKKRKRKKVVKDSIKIVSVAPEDQAVAEQEGREFREETAQDQAVVDALGEAAHIDPQAQELTNEVGKAEIPDVPEKEEVVSDQAPEELPEGVVMGAEPTVEDDEKAAEEVKRKEELFVEEKARRLENLESTRCTLLKSLRRNEMDINRLKEVKAGRWTYMAVPGGVFYKVPSEFIAKDYAARINNDFTDEENIYDAMHNPVILREWLKEEMNWFSISEKVIPYTPNRDTAIDKNWSRIIVTSIDIGDQDA